MTDLKFLFFCISNSMFTYIHTSSTPTEAILSRVRFFHYLHIKQKGGHFSQKRFEVIQRSDTSYLSDFGSGGIHEGFSTGSIYLLLKRRDALADIFLNPAVACIHCNISSAWGMRTPFKNVKYRLDSNWYQSDGSNSCFFEDCSYRTYGSKGNCTGVS